MVGGRFLRHPKPSISGQDVGRCVRNRRRGLLLGKLGGLHIAFARWLRVYLPFSLRIVYTIWPGCYPVVCQGVLLYMLMMLVRQTGVTICGVLHLGLPL